MRGLGLTNRRPRPWSKRITSDGSAIPKLRRAKVSHTRSVHLRWTQLAQLLLPWLIMGPLFVVFTGFSLLVQVPELEALAAVFGLRAMGIVNLILFVRPVLFPFAGVLMILVISNVVLTIRWRRRLGAAVVAARCRFCPRCTYDLSGSSSTMLECPECGQVVSRRECVRLWCKALR